MNVVFLGEDRAGKTSLVNSLKGKPFDKEEPRTEGVVMCSPIKSAGTQAWKNSTCHQKTPFDHESTALIVRDVKDRPAKQKTREQSPEPRVNGNGMLSFLLDANVPEI